MRSGIYMAEISSPDDALEMANQRNMVREYLTHDRHKIQADEQLDWYRNTYKPANERQQMFGYVVRDYFTPIGYGLITERHNKLWVSGGINAETRGRGIGKFVFSTMTDIIHEDLESTEAWLDVLNDNDRAMELYKKIGYRVVDESAELTTMVHEQPYYWGVPAA